MRIVIAVLIVLVWIPKAYAHPHQWLDYKIKLVFNNSKALKAIHQTWVFDSFYAGLMLSEYDDNQNNLFDTDELAKLATDNMRNLKDYSYFTAIESGGKKHSFLGVHGIRSYLQDNRIVLEFTSDLETPIHPPFIYSVYDPSYYIEMKHMKTDAVSFEGANCAAAIQKPNPDAVYISLAQALDKNAIAPDNLGVNFAEKVTVTCQ
jgi:ABC-type uncharacterized transport system substrate-binding protein